MNMIKKLHRKFILAGTAAVIIIVVGAFAVLNATVYFHEINDMERIMVAIADNDGRLPDGSRIDEEEGYSALNRLINGDDWVSSTPDFLYQVRYFTVRWDKEGAVENVDISHTAAFSSTEAMRYAAEAIESPDDRGFMNRGRAIYCYLRRPFNDGSQMVVVLDCTRNIISIKQMLRYSFLFSVGFIVLYFIIVAILSNIAIKPFIRNMENQKRFITNAGHELKTPIAIISANAETLEMLNGKSQWTENILKQVRRQSQLINNLIMLSKKEEDQMENLTFEDIDLSEQLANVAQTFEALAQDNEKQMTTKIPAGIHVFADQRCLYEIISILLDNAVKYCDAGGCISVSAEKKKLGKGPSFTVSNTYASGKNIDYTQFFERFYRGDESHNSIKPGYGIGLSMAEELVHLIHGTIHVVYKYDTISFIVSLKEKG